ncbi:MAG: hypothetical protein E7430_01915 [Ruminococcaceae bacterium]|nr:hypothetical protein [Oscillospiraceae bacterium]
MAINGNYLTLFPTPGGDKYHMFRFTESGCAVENSMGPTPLVNFKVSDTSFSGDMAAGPTTHSFEGVLEGADIKVSAKVIEVESGKVINTYGGVLTPFDGDVLPENPESEGSGGPPGPPPAI